MTRSLETRSKRYLALDFVRGDFFKPEARDLGVFVLKLANSSPVDNACIVVAQIAAEALGCYATRHYGGERVGERLIPLVDRLADDVLRRHRFVDANTSMPSDYKCAEISPYRIALGYK